MKTLTLTLILISNSVFATDQPFSGSWVGQGTLFDSIEIYNCNSVQLVIDQRENAFLIKSNTYLCGPNGTALEGMSLGIQNGNLYLGQDIVGTVTKTKARYEIEQNISNYNAKWTGVLTLENGKLKLQQSRTVTARGVTEIIVGEAILKKVD